jgi:hypothetical protein
MRVVALVLLATALCAVGTSVAAADSEIAQKHEWSVLQTLEMKYRNRQNETGILVMPDVDGTHLTAIGLPRKNRPVGYVFLLANPTTTPRVKVLPKAAEYSLSSAEFRQIGQQTTVDSEVMTYLAAHMR